MVTLPLFEEPVSTPPFEELVAELDRLVDDRSLSEVDAALEDLFLARVAESATRAA
jgi:hypothetical protein